MPFLIYLVQEVSLILYLFFLTVNTVEDFRRISSLKLIPPRLSEASASLWAVDVPEQTLGPVGHPIGSTATWSSVCHGRKSTIDLLFYVFASLQKKTLGLFFRRKVKTRMKQYKKLAK